MERMDEDRLPTMSYVHHKKGGRGDGKNVFDERH